MCFLWFRIWCFSVFSLCDVMFIMLGCVCDVVLCIGMDVGRLLLRSVCDGMFVGIVGIGEVGNDVLYVYVGFG